MVIVFIGEWEVGITEQSSAIPTPHSISLNSLFPSFRSPSTAPLHQRRGDALLHHFAFLVGNRAQPGNDATAPAGAFFFFQHLGFDADGVADVHRQLELPIANA